eukprot:TRINITY_DN13513_c0_g1_i1.p1 TRINITY_DN13513_c0_g1~~TRINITY_DN13513_c0_g1_i1.p1  ORF type:complete len:542 (+),score=71.21 TRINITY_DN13513_c0_g1_i1:172-1797(+)
MMHDHLKSPLNHHLQTINYDTSNKSTKGASKLRRDHINHEINKLRDLLPIPASARQRLSQLQLMALILVYVRKTNYFEKLYKSLGLGAKEKNETTSFGFAKALDGFMLVITQTGRILYISENAAEYLGHSMEDLLIHGDSIYDIVDKQDHPTLHVHLSKDTEDPAAPEELPKSTKSKKQIFLCRINVSRNARRQMRFGDQKVILVSGHFYSDLPLCSRDEPVFVAWCTPLAMPENREIVVQGATNVFTTVHSLDMKMIEIDDNGERHLGYSRHDLLGVSLYHLLHPDSMRELQAKHRLVTGAESDKSSILLIRLQKEKGSFIWVHTVMQIKDSSEDTQVPVIICTNQILSEEEATVMKANSWLYHYYMVQSRLQYGLAYGAHTPSLAAYYPHMLGAPPQPQPFAPYDPNPHPISPAYLSGGNHSGFGGTTPLYPGYLYSPAPAPHYHLPPATEHSAHINLNDSKEHASGPLDFSKDFSSRSQEYSSQQSSPSLRSDTSSSPVYQPPHESLYGAPEVSLLTAGGRHNISDHHYKSHHRGIIL